MLSINCMDYPLPKVWFVRDDGKKQKGYLYLVFEGDYYISQNSKYENFGNAQNWVVTEDKIIKVMSEEYNKAWREFVGDLGETTPEIEVEFSSAWSVCKAKVLDILNTPIESSPLSQEGPVVCDSRFIDKIKAL